MKHKEYRIETVQDIIDCTNEDNIDNFLKDLKAIIMTNHFVKSISKDVKNEKYYTWIDDNENNLTINLEVKDKE